jgi:imidazolonepropionase-like amidohydrolase
MELAYMVEYGVSPTDALTAATGAAADLNRLRDRGRIHVGHKADLLLVSGNPTRDIDCVAKPNNHRLVVKDGKQLT